MQRDIKFTLDFIKYPTSSVLIEIGNTRVLCNVTIENSIPPFLKDTNSGWVTAEYSMLPAATRNRTRREVNSGKVSSRTAEIQRLIGRSLRAVVDLEQMTGFTALVDCEVLSADGGTRTASITGSAVALYIAFDRYVQQGIFTQNPMRELIAAISVGIHQNEIVVDLDYDLDSNADVDMNIVMTESGNFVEIQGTGEKSTFSSAQLSDMLTQGEKAIKKIIQKQRVQISE
jgi:ribonuclease PH